MRKIIILLCVLLILSCGNKYDEIKIGRQTWMSENLNVDKFRNGDDIPEAKTSEEWSFAAKNGKPAWCYYQNDKNNGDKYGKLYNWYAVNDSRGLAPLGWAIPSLADYNLLEKEVKKLKDVYGDINRQSGGKMKYTEGWKDNGNGTNESEFGGLPGGYRDGGGNFHDAGEEGFWWTDTEQYAERVSYVNLRSDKKNLLDDRIVKSVGFSVRCIKGSK